MGVLKKYRAWKRRILGFPGEQIAGYVRSRRSDGGLSICLKINYCRNKAFFREKLALLQQITDDELIAIAGDKASEKLKEAAEESASELLSSAAEFIADTATAFSDTVLPVSVLIKLFKYGLDDLCPCCLDCEGLGLTGTLDCSSCLGDGMRRPFLN